MKRKRYSKYNTTEQQPFEQPRKKRILLYFFGGFIIILMLGSILGYYSDESATSETSYNNHAFVPYGTGWITNLNGQQLTFTYHPKELESYSTDPLSLGQKVYLAFNSTLTPQDETLQRLRAYLLFTGRTAPFACLNDPTCGDYPLVTCTNSDIVLYYTPGPATSFTRTNNCVTITAAPGDETLITEFTAYKILGIM